MSGGFDPVMSSISLGHGALVCQGDDDAMIYHGDDDALICQGGEDGLV